MPHLLRRIVGKVPRLKAVFADQGYRGTPSGGLIRRRVIVGIGMEIDCKMIARSRNQSLRAGSHR